MSAVFLSASFITLLWNLQVKKSVKSIQICVLTKSTTFFFLLWESFGESRMRGWTEWDWRKKGRELHEDLLSRPKDQNFAPDFSI